jgi:anti-sigma-K factor RskA
MTTLLLDAAAAYALGAVDAETRRAVEAALPTDAALAREVDSFAPVVAMLALAAPSLAPPPALRARVLADATTVRPIDSARRAGRGAARGLTVGRVVPWLAVAASLGAVAVVGGRLAAAREESAALTASLQELTARAAASDSLLATLLAPDVSTLRLTSSGAPPGARLYWNAPSGRVILAAWQLPPAPPGRTYQLWGIPKDGKPVSLGTFAALAGGEARAVFAVPAGLRIAVGAVTEEPEGGSPQPTSTPFLVGQLAALQ